MFGPAETQDGLRLMRFSQTCPRTASQELKARFADVSRDAFVSPTELEGFLKGRERSVDDGILMRTG